MWPSPAILNGSWDARIIISNITSKANKIPRFTRTVGGNLKISNKKMKAWQQQDLSWSTVYKPSREPVHYCQHRLQWKDPWMSCEMGHEWHYWQQADIIIMQIRLRIRMIQQLQWQLIWLCQTHRKKARLTTFYIVLVQ